MIAPPSSAAVSAREAAFRAVAAWRRSGAFVMRTLDATPALAGAERRLAVELACGAVRTQATLDALLTPHITRPRPRIEDDLWTLLQLGAYQLAFLGAIPARAAVHETVELARRMGQPRWTGFANAVLRKIADALTPDRLDSAAPNALPLESGRYRACRLDFFPDPAVDPVGYVAAAQSLPRWLVERWSGRFDLSELSRLGFWFRAPPRVWLRVNPLRATRDATLERIRAAGVAATAGERPESIRLDGTASPESLPGFAEGWFTVQDESAMAAAALLAPAPGESVLDLCAAPGVKTTHLAELMQNRGRIVATDVSDERLARVRQNCERLGATIVEPRRIEIDGTGLPDGPFDAALVDVPCSNTGVLARRPEARWRLRPRDLTELPAIQRQLVLRACERVRPGGRIVYSTCSIEPEENGDVVAAVLSETDLQGIEARMHVPGRPADGGYQALLRRGSGG